jgi:NADH-quinone oxidoreductase subunit H
MEAFWSTYAWPFIIMLAQSLLLLVILLITIAYVLYADRKIWAWFVSLALAPGR